MTEIKAHNGKLYLSAIFDCFDSGVLNLAMDTNMKAKLKGAIVHSDRGIQYTSYLYRSTRDKYDITQSMNSSMVADVMPMLAAKACGQEN